MLGRRVGHDPRRRDAGHRLRRRSCCANIGAETDAFGAARIPAYAAQAAYQYSAPANRAALLDRWEPGLRELLMAAEAGSDHQLTFARSYAGAAHSDAALDDLEGLLDGSLVIEGLAIDNDLRWALVVSLAQVGPLRRRRDRRRSSSATTPSPARRTPPSALASRPTAEAKAEAWDQATVQENVPNETHRSICLSFMRFGQEDMLAPYLEKYLEAADDIWDRLGTQKASTALEYIFPKPLAGPELLDKRRRVAGHLGGQPRRQALRPRGPRRRRPRARARRPRTPQG